MANNILTALAGNVSFKLYSSDGISVLNSVYALEVTAQLSAKLLKNMAEDGTAIIDSKILMPIQVSVSVMANSTEAVEQVNSIFQNINGQYKLYSRGLYFEKLTLARESLTQSAAVMSATPIELVFNGILLENENYPVTAQSGDSDTIIGGIISTATETAANATTLISGLANDIL